MIFSYGATSPIDPTRRAIGQYNYSYSPPQKLSYQQQQPQALQQQPFDPSAGIGEFEARQFQPQALQQQPFDSSAGIGDFEARQFQPQQPQALQQMGMQQQSYQPMPQALGMQPLLQQFRTQQRPYQSPFQQRSGQMSPDGAMGNRSGSAYGYSNNSLTSRLNNLAPLNMNALNFSY
jgi:hypothetical protein